MPTFSQNADFTAGREVDHTPLRVKHSLSPHSWYLHTHRANVNRVRSALIWSTRGLNRRSDTMPPVPHRPRKRANHAHLSHTRHNCLLIWRAAPLRARPDATRVLAGRSTPPGTRAPPAPLLLLLLPLELWSPASPVAGAADRVASHSAACRLSKGPRSAAAAAPPPVLPLLVDHAAHSDPLGARGRAGATPHGGRGRAALARAAAAAGC